jgi:Secretion system C-terminal sorting domain
VKIIKLLFLTFSVLFLTRISLSNPEPYVIDLEQINLPGTPSIHSFAFAKSNGKWLLIGGRTNGLHGFNPLNAFPTQYANKNIFVIDPNTSQTWSRNIFSDFSIAAADPIRSTNMEFTQVGNKLYIAGGYGYDSTSNSFITFPVISVIDVDEMINAIITGAPVMQYMRQLTDSRLQVAGGELNKLGDYFYLIGGHNFTGSYQRMINNQIYTNQIRKFMINDNGSVINISDYSAQTDTVNYHRRDMNVVPAVKPDGITPYLILYGGVFQYNHNLPFLNPVYIDENGATVDTGFEQKMSQYTCSLMPVFSLINHSMSTTFFGGTSLYYYDEITQSQVYDSLVPFIDDITTLTRFSDGTSEEKISSLKLPGLLGTNAEFILNDSIPHFDNDVIKLDELTGRTFAGYIFGGIRALMPNNGLSYPSGYIFKVYITPDSPLPVELSSFTSTVHKKNVSLKWSTASEQNNSGFEIERSTENGEWKLITFVRGAENSNIPKNYYYEDLGLLSGKYKYRLKQIDFNGHFHYYNLSNDVIIGTPEKYSLSQNYPNPFNPSTKIDFEIPESGNVSIKFYDNKGAEIKTLVNEFKTAGYYSVELFGNDLASGVYFYKIESGNFVETRKMFLIK